jgi:uncharacterized protein YutE (UPF0331/DUF86 family)
MLNGVILRKLEALDRTLEELRSLGTIDVGSLEGDWRTRRAVERDLQVLVEIVIDVCQRLISLAGKSPAPSGAGAVERCVELGALCGYEPYGQMVQFHNFIVHRYEEVESSYLVTMVNDHLRDFEQFRREVVVYVQS